jgi:hypothetical protein
VCIHAHQDKKRQTPDESGAMPMACLKRPTRSGQVVWLKYGNTDGICGALSAITRVLASGLTPIRAKPAR